MICSKQKMPKTRSLFGSLDRLTWSGFLSEHSAEPQTNSRKVSALALPWSDMHEEAERILLATYAPAGVLIDAEIEILQFRGDTGPCLTPALADKSEPAQDGRKD